MPSQKGLLTFHLSTLSFFFSMLPSLVLHFVPVLCPAMYLSSLIQVSTWVFGDKKRGKMGTVEGVDGWGDCWRESGLLSGAQCDYQYRNFRKGGMILYYPHLIFSLFILFSALVFHWPYVCNTCLLFGVKKRWIVFISRAAVLNTSSVLLCIFPLFFSSSLLLSHPYYF